MLIIPCNFSSAHILSVCFTLISWNIAAKLNALLSFCSICFCRSPVVSKVFHVTLQLRVSIQVRIICFNNHTFSLGVELCIVNFLHMQWGPLKMPFYTLFVVGLMSDYRDCCQVFQKQSFSSHWCWMKRLVPNCFRNVSWINCSKRFGEKCFFPFGLILSLHICLFGCFPRVVHLPSHPEYDSQQRSMA